MRRRITFDAAITVTLLLSHREQLASSKRPGSRLQHPTEAAPCSRFGGITHPPGGPVSVAARRREQPRGRRAVASKVGPVGGSEILPNAHNHPIRHRKVRWLRPARSSAIARCQTSDHAASLAAGRRVSGRGARSTRVQGLRRCPAHPRVRGCGCKALATRPAGPRQKLRSRVISTSLPLPSRSETRSCQLDPGSSALEPRTLDHARLGPVVAAALPLEPGDAGRALDEFGVGAVPAPRAAWR